MSVTPLPVAGQAQPCGPGDRIKPRPTRRWRVRALVLIGVHVAIALHILHWKLTGRTVTPVEPSEAMQTLELGYVNAGFILFVVLILATLVFGRFFCGWGCHMVFLQDVCGWILRKLGLRPKPFRSRLLVFVPLFAAFYMFVWPQVVRIWEGRSAPEWVAHLSTEDFWATFPGPAIAILTFVVCGFLAVVFLGNKGFCTYACPYGAFFYNADRFAPGKIRVTDACNQCGHCTATCSSNVRVHEEVKLYKMVVDPACMKCMDCVSVCPNDALYWGIGKTALGVRKGAPKRKPLAYDLSWPEELALAGVFVWCLYAFRGLYGSIPFLLSLGLSAITAFLLLVGARALYAPSVRMQRLQLKSAGRFHAAGIAFLAGAGVLLAFVGHSSAIQFRAHRGDHLLSRAQALFERRDPATSAEADALAKASLAEFEWCRSFGLAEVGDWESKTGSLLLFLGRTEEAARRFEAAARLDPKSSAAKRGLLLASTSLGRFAAAADAGAAALQLAPGDRQIRLAYAGALTALGRSEDAVRTLAEGVRLVPGDAALRASLGLALADAGKFDDALSEIERALSGDPGLNAARVAACRLAARAGKLEQAVRHGEAARRNAPFDSAALGAWAEALTKAGKAREELKALTKAKSDDDASWLAAAYLYRELGDAKTADALFRRFESRHAAEPHP